MKVHPFIEPIISPYSLFESQLIGGANPFDGNLKTRLSFRLPLLIIVLGTPDNYSNCLYRLSCCRARIR